MIASLDPYSPHEMCMHERGCVSMQVFLEVEKAMESLPSQRSRSSARTSDYGATDAQGAHQLAAA